MSLAGSLRAVDGETCLKIKEHIESFDVNTVHYHNSRKEYIDAKLGMTKMHNLLKNIQNVKLHIFIENILKNKIN